METGYTKLQPYLVDGCAGGIVLVTALGVDQLGRESVLPTSVRAAGRRAGRQVVAIQIDRLHGLAQRASLLGAVVRGGHGVRECGSAGIRFAANRRWRTSAEGTVGEADDGGPQLMEIGRTVLKRRDAVRTGEGEREIGRSRLERVSEAAGTYPAGVEHKPWGHKPKTHSSRWRQILCRSFAPKSLTRRR